MDHIKESLAERNAYELCRFKEKVSDGLGQLVRLQGEAKRIADLLELTKKNLRELKFEPVKLEDLGL